MKKRIFFGAILLAALVLNACVDNTESPEVIEARKANVEVMKSLAALNSANAEAVKIISVTEAALNTAKADVEKANAQKTTAETEITKLEAARVAAQNDAEKAEIETRIIAAKIQKAKAEKELELIAGDLKRMELQMQTELANAELSYEEAKLNLENQKDQLAAREYERLMSLFNKYTAELKELNRLKGLLVTSKIDLASLEKGLTSVKAYQDQTIERLNRNIVVYKASIETYKQYAAYSNDPAKLNTELQKARTEYNLANDAANKAVQDYNKANNDALNDVNGLRRAIEETEFYQTASNYPASMYVNNLYNTEYTRIESEDGRYGYSYYKRMYPVLSDLRQFEFRLTDAKKSLPAYEESVKTAQKTYDDAVKATAAAKKILDETKADDPTYQQKESDYRNAVYAEISAKNNLESAKTQLANQQKYIADFQASYDVVSDPAKLDEIKAAIDAFNKQYENAAALLFDARAKRDEADKKDAVFNALYNIYVSAINLESTIADIERDIIQAEQEIAGLKNVANAEQAIALLKTEIANLEAQIKNQELEVARAKAAYEAALPKE